MSISEETKFSRFHLLLRQCLQVKGPVTTREDLMYEQQGKTLLLLTILEENESECPKLIARTTDRRYATPLKANRTTVEDITKKDHTTKIEGGIPPEADDSHLVGTDKLISYTDFDDECDCDSIPSEEPGLAYKMKMLGVRISTWPSGPTF